MSQGRLQGRRVVVGISGGIAAYKAIEVVRLLTEAGAEVRVMLTPEATRFVTPLTLEALLNDRRNLEGLRVVVSAGGTREPVDPVRYVGNFSSGKMGRALAETASARGADVTLVTTVPTNPEGINELVVTSATEMLAALKTACAGADILVMAAAVADYAPDKVAAAKLRRTDQPIDLHLRPNVDVLKSLGPLRGLFRVGFAAETEDLRAQAQQKLSEKQLDLMVANQIGVDGQGLASDYNAVTIVSPSGVVAEVPRLPKWEVAGQIWDAIDAARNRGS